MIRKILSCKNKHYIDVVLLPNFHLSARSSSFFLAFFLLFCGALFLLSLSQKERLFYWSELYATNINQSSKGNMRPVVPFSLLVALLVYGSRPDSGRRPVDYRGNLDVHLLPSHPMRTNQNFESIFCQSYFLWGREVDSFERDTLFRNLMIIH